MKAQTAVVIGGCGFIGVHCVARLLKEGFRVLCIDNLSRPTGRANLHWIADQFPSGRFTFTHADIRHASDLERVMADFARRYGRPEAVIHQAAQVAVTTSVIMPRNDFETNALGTFNVLEAVRATCPEALVIFSSTNKVYGHLSNIPVVEGDTRYAFAGLPDGVSADQPLDFYSPYGCSKGAADQYVRDYARIYNLRTLVFRQSCIYGTRQFGHEDQGWVAWFVIAAALKRKTTIYGNGKQVRDLLWVDDLVEAYWKAWKAGLSGEIFNIGGGPRNTLSLLELLDILRELNPALAAPEFSEWRPGDQPIYVSDVERLRQRLGWQPAISPRQGVEILARWVHENRRDLEELLAPPQQADQAAAG